MVNAGRAYLYSFSDSVFSGITREAVIGRGFNTGKDLNVATLGGSELFGMSVALDGNQLAVGASQEGDFTFGHTQGAVYLFSFADSNFSGGTLEGVIGSGISGGKNVTYTPPANNLSFGSSLSLENNRLAVGVDQLTISSGASDYFGGVYVYNFTDSTFSGGTLERIIGKGYAGGNNINIASLDSNDFFGSGVSFNGGRLAIGARGDGGSGNTAGFSGAVYLFGTSPGVGSAVNTGAAYATNAAGSITITPADLVAILNAGTAVTLQASNDITVNEEYVPVVNGGAFTLQAGRSILINANINTARGNLNLYANDLAANGVVNAQRDAGNAVITMANDTYIDTGLGSIINIELRPGTGNTNNGAGAITLENVQGAQINVKNQNAGQGVVINGDFRAIASGFDIEADTITTGADASLHAFDYARFKPYNTNRSIGVAGAAGDLQITSQLLNQISASYVQIGANNGSTLSMAGYDASGRNYGLRLYAYEMDFTGGTTTMAANKQLIAYANFNGHRLCRGIQPLTRPAPPISTFTANASH